MSTCSIFPNVEVRKGFLDLVATEYLKPREDVSTMASDAARALRAGNLNALRDKMTADSGTIDDWLAESSSKATVGNPRHGNARLTINLWGKAIIAVLPLFYVAK